MKVYTDERVPIKVWSDDADENAITQLRNVAKLPFVFKHVAAMPDVHWGMGATVGSVIATHGAVIPAAVGVDIGCGMIAVDLGLSADALKADASNIRKRIEQVVPVGFNQHSSLKPEVISWEHWDERPDMDEKLLQKALHQMGTLGGGNHFIELCQDERGQTWAMLHSGSRGVGKIMADIHMKAAKEQCAKHFVLLPDKDLAYLVEGTEEFDAYIEAVTWCQRYAWANRLFMMDAIIGALKSMDYDAKQLLTVHCHHNYVTKEQHFGASVWLTRKGAVCARKGMPGIIPGSMGARSYIVEGLGNPESFNSCSHGAGRKMGRNEAKRNFTVADLEAQTDGVECRKDEGVLDELPGAYKDIDVVMANQTDLVRPVHTLKQFLCIKG